MEEPVLRSIGDSRSVACHYPLERWPMTPLEVRRAVDQPAIEEPIAASDASS